MAADAWQCVSTDTGGTVSSLVSAGLVFSATPVGAFRSVDGGRSWTSSVQGPFPPLAGTVAACHNVVYATAHDGLYRSSDAAETWEPMLVGGELAAVACVRPDIVIAAIEQTGIVRSEDGGRTWSPANAGLLDLDVLCLAFSGSVGFAGTSSGIYRTRNAGKAWRYVAAGENEPAVQCLAVTPDAQLVLAGTEADGLLRSSDGGRTWQPTAGFEGAGVSAVATSASLLAAATEDCVFVSSDGGTTWRLVERPPGLVLALTFVDEDVLLAGMHRVGVARLTDRTAPWQLANRGLNARLVVDAAWQEDGTIDVTDVDDGTLVEPRRAVRHDGTLIIATTDGVQISRDGGITFVDWSEGLQPRRVVALCDLQNHQPGAVGAVGVGGTLWRRTF